jgi:transposase InsO family protein
VPTILSPVQLRLLLARTAVFEYIEVWYSQQRRHSSLGYGSPAAFELQAAMRDISPAA